MAAVSLLDPDAGAIVLVLTIAEATDVAHGLRLVEREAFAAGLRPTWPGGLKDRLKAAINLGRERALFAAAEQAREDPDRLLTTDEVGGLLGLSTRRVRQLLVEGALPGGRVGRCWRVRAGDLTACGNYRK